MDTRYPFNPEPAEPDYYYDLGFPTFDDEHAYFEAGYIKAAWLKLVKRHHPDKKGPGEDGNAAEFRRVQEAYDCLRDEDKRTRYDAEYPRIRLEWLRYQKLASKEEDAVRQETETSDTEVVRQEEANKEVERQGELRDRRKRYGTNRHQECVAEWNRREAERVAEEQKRITRERWAEERAEGAAWRFREQREDACRGRFWRQ